MTAEFTDEEKIEAQKIYDKVVSHLRAQKQPSVGDDGCAYRGYCGLKCAVGVLITDEWYNTGLEGHSPLEAKVQLALEHSGYPTTPAWLEFYTSIQDAHDAGNRYGNCDDDGHYIAEKVSETWEERFKNVAEHYGLEYTAP